MAILDAHERTALHYLFKIEAQMRTRDSSTDDIGEDDGGVAQLPTMKELLTLLTDQIGHAKSYYNGTVDLKLKDVSFDKDGQFACVLINAVDATKATGVIRNKKSGERRETKNNDDDGDETSLHLVFNLSISEGCYEVTADKVPKLNSKVIKGFLNSGLLAVANSNKERFERPHRFNAVDDKGKAILVRYKPIFIVASRPDEAFLNDIHEGKISDVSLIRSEATNQITIDGNRKVNLKESIIKLDTSDVNGSMFEHIKSVGSHFARKNYSRIQFHYDNQKGSKGRISMNTDDLRFDSLELAFSKKTHMTNFPKLKDAYEEVHEPLMRGLKEAQG